ncbi:GNAT family N-acetyltransferase [Parasphingopyxis sp.]|uniref:GNAT family N-acetyltransferase n=1 Tax=Parasphingopyxis sp. TaxID=1920299 RepID=UPI002609328F|nr:GNAT family N-acetyltransferase [Parasphingopyxis sp.]
MAEDKLDIQLDDSGSKGRYFMKIDGVGEEAELTFSRASETLVIVDHTGVPDSLRDRGLGKALAQRVVADARAKGFKIVPLCPFFKAIAQRHADWQDVVQG